MKEINLFQAQDGSWITSSHLLSLLEKVKAPQARVLYMHTGFTLDRPTSNWAGRNSWAGFLK